MLEQGNIARPQLYARIVGVAYLAITAAGVLGVGLVDSKLIVAGDTAATMRNIAADGWLFRLGILATVATYLSVLVAAWAMYLLLEQVHRNLALLGMLARLAEAVVGMATVFASLAVVALLRERGSADGLPTARAQSLLALLIELRTSSMDLVLLLIGVGGTAFCYLFYTSRYVPRVLAAWGILTYLSMFAIAFVSILVPDHPKVLELVFYGPGGTFELVFGLWLVIKGVATERHIAGPAPRSATA